MKTEKILLISLLTFGCAGILINTAQMFDSPDFHPADKMPSIIENRIKSDLVFLSSPVSLADSVQISEVTISDKFIN